MPLALKLLLPQSAACYFVLMRVSGLLTNGRK
jgi:hypothetical protein